MSKQNILLILWIIFGFVFIVAIDTILYFIIHLLYFVLAELGTSYNLMTYIIPIITLTLYLLTTYFLITRVNTKSKASGIYLTEFPKKLIILLGLVILILTPVTNKLSGLYAEDIIDNTFMQMGDYFLFIGWFNLGFAISQTIILIGLVGFLLTKLKELNNN